MPQDPKSSIACKTSQWSLVQVDDIDIAFVARQHRRRLSITTQLALTAYHQCNPELASIQTVFASRYGEYSRTFGILSDIAAGQPTSPAAFSVSVHNTPSGITGIATGNRQPSSTVAANSATVEAGFLEAALQQADRPADDLIFIHVDEPLPTLYEPFQPSEELPFAVALRLSPAGPRSVELSWVPESEPEPAEPGIPASGRELVQRLDAGAGQWTHADGRLLWEWRVG